MIEIFNLSNNSETQFYKILLKGEIVFYQNGYEEKLKVAQKLFALNEK